MKLQRNTSLPPVITLVCLSIVEPTISLFAPPAQADNLSTWKLQRAQAESAKLARDRPKSVKLFNDNLKLAEKFGANDEHVIASLLDLGDAYGRFNQFDKALPLFEKALLLSEKKYGTYSAQLIAPLNGVIRVTCAADHCADTVPFLNRLLDIRRKNFGPNSKEVPVTLILLGEAYEKQNKFDQARSYFEQAISAQEALTGKGSAGAVALKRNLLRIESKRHKSAR